MSGSFLLTKGFEMILRLWRYVLNELRARRDPITYARDQGVCIGENCRILGHDKGRFGSEPYLVSLGDHVTITSGVTFLTHDGGVWVFRSTEPKLEVVAPIKVGNNVFIGLNTLILPGVKIGDNCVIGAGSIVTKNIPPNSVAVGSPCKPIKSISEYKESLASKSFHSRGLTHSEKKDLFLSHYEESTSTDKSL